MSQNRLPKYSLRKASGQARVCIDGRDIYLGPYDSAESRQRYQQLIQSLQLRRQAPHLARLTLGQLCLLYVEHAEKYYRKNGLPTSEVSSIKSALKPVVRLFRNDDVAGFTPRMLKAVRDEFVKADCSRYTANKHTGRIIRMFSWAVSEELCHVNVVATLREVPSLAAGRSEARETAPIRPVPEADVYAIQEYVDPLVWGTIRFQLFTAARPGEALTVRPRDLDTRDEVWTYTPESHKTQHHGKPRLILCGPRAQEILGEFMSLGTDRYLFGLDGGLRAYERTSYTRAISRACKKAGVNHWHPNQLRHTASTRIRQAASIEEAKTVLGHSDFKVTEIYAERDMAAARAVLARIG